MGCSSPSPNRCPMAMISEQMMGTRLVLIGFALLLVLLPLVGMTAQGQERIECANASAGRIAGIGALFVHDEVGLSIRYWVSDIDGSEMALLAPSGGERLCFLAKGLRRVIDTCYIDGIIDMGLEIPVGDSINWQRFYVSGEVEWSFPGFPQLAITLGLEISALHWYSSWYSEALTVLGLHLYA